LGEKDVSTISLLLLTVRIVSQNFGLTDSNNTHLQKQKPDGGDGRHVGITFRHIRFLPVV